jgi:circadian clock protein KaiC
MIGGKGFYRGSSVLVSGTAGTGKTTLASCLADASCRRGERCLYLGYEESASQLVRNMESVGLDLRTWMDEGLLHVHATRPTALGIEAHLITLNRLVESVEPGLVVMDPVTALLNAGSAADAQSMLTRTLDFLKSKQITAVLTSLVQGGDDEERTRTSISSLIDTWILLRDIELGGERNRGLYVLKSRGMPHSNQIREFLVTEAGIQIQDVYVGPEGVLTGTMRLAQEARERSAALGRSQEVERRRRELDRRRQALEAEIASKREQFAAEEEEMMTLLEEERASVEQSDQDRTAMTRSRRADAAAATAGPRAHPRNNKRQASEKQKR